MNLNKNKNPENWLKYLRFLLIGSYIIKLFNFIFSKNKIRKIENNLKDYIKEEENEVDKFVEGKESFEKFCRDSNNIFLEYFIPCDQNNHKPKILRTKSLIIISFALLLLKFAVISYLFFIYPNTAKMTEIITQELHGLINQSRIENNLPVLTFNNKLNQVAEAKADDMIAKDYFAHQSPDGRMPWDWINRDEYPYLYVGENLAMNFTSAKSAHNALMLSTSHKKNILNSKYADIGLAVVSGELNGQKTNILVEIFGSTKYITAPLAKNTAPVVAPAIKEDIKNSPEKTDVLAVQNENINNDEKLNIGDKPEKSDLPAEETIPAQPVASEPVESNQVDNNLITDEESPAAQKKIIAAVSPNPELENNISAPVEEIEIKDYKKLGVATLVINYSKYIFLAALIFLSIALLLNIFIRINIQHKPVIIQTLLVIIFIAGLLTVKIHFVENIIEHISVL